MAIFDANVGVTSSGGVISSVADQSGNGNNLAAASGVTVGPSVNGLPSIQFAGTSIAANSGLRSTGSWLAGMTRDITIAVAFKTGSTLPNGMTIFNLEPATPNYSDDLFFWITNGGFGLSKRASGWGSISGTIIPAPSTNTLYKVVARFNPNTGSGCTLDWSVNGGTKTSVIGPAFGTSANPYTTGAIGQAATSVAQNNYGMNGMASTSGQLLEIHYIKGCLSDADVASYQAYLTSKWGN